MIFFVPNNRRVSRKANREVSRTRLPVTTLHSRSCVLASPLSCFAWRQPVSPGNLSATTCLGLFVLFLRALTQDSTCSHPADSLKREPCFPARWRLDASISGKHLVISPRCKTMTPHLLCFRSRRLLSANQTKPLLPHSLEGVC